MKLVKYSHRNAKKCVPNYILYPVYFDLKRINFLSKKKGTRDLRRQISDILISHGWSKPVRVSPESQITITSVFGKVGLCLQFGNMARFYADLLKLQLMYSKGTISSAIYIVPTRCFASILGDNLANYERITNELLIFQQIICVPIMLVGIEGKR